MTQLSRYWRLAVPVLLIAVAGNAAQFLNVDYGAHKNPAFTKKSGKAAVGVGEADFWNLYSRDLDNGGFRDSGVMEALKWHDGATSDVRLEVQNASGAWATFNSDPMMKSYLYPGGRSGAITSTFKRLPAGRYQVLVYAHGQPPEENAKIELMLNSVLAKSASTSSSANWDPGTWTEGGQYVRFQNVVIAAEDTVKVVSKGGVSGLAVINGVQFVLEAPVVDPPAHPPLVNIDFTAHTNPAFPARKSGPAAIGHSDGDIWNIYSRDGEGGGFLAGGVVTNLLWSNGEKSGIDLHVTNAAGAWFTLNDDPMFKSYLYPLGGGPDIKVELLNVPAGLYNVYVYAHGQPPRENSTIHLSTAVEYPNQATSSAENWDQPGWTEGSEYVAFKEVRVGDEGVVKIRSSPKSSNLAAINGLQMIRVGDLPPPPPLKLANVDFTAHKNPAFEQLKTGPAAIGLSSNDHWNRYSRDAENGDFLHTGGIPNLRWSDESLSGIRLSVTNAAGAWVTLNSDPMFKSYLYPLSRNGNIDITLSSVPSGKYDIYVYAHGQPPVENAVVELVANGFTAGRKTTSSASNWDPEGWKEDHEYVVFRGINVAENGTISIASKPGLSGLAVINGLQIRRTDDAGEIPSAPKITSHPEDLDLVAGSTARFEVAVAGTLPFGFRWFKGDHQIEGGNQGALEIPNVSLSHSGNYHVVVSNAWAMATSRVARLEVIERLQAPKIAAQPIPRTVLPGQPVKFAVLVTNSSEVLYQWYRRGEKLQGATHAELMVEAPSIGDAGEYHVVVSNSVGSEKSRSARLTFYSPVEAPLINVDFGAHLNPYFRLKTGPGALGKSQEDLWNLYSRDAQNGGWIRDGSLGNLRWSDGAPSSIGITVTNANGAWFTLNSDPMFESYLYPLSRVGDIGARLEQLPSGIYDLLVYAHGQPPSEFATISVATTGNDYGIKTTSKEADWDSPSWREGGQYVRFNDIRVAHGGSIQVTSKPNGNSIAVINALQLVLKDGNPQEPVNPTVADWTMEEGTLGEPARVLKDHAGRGHHFEWSGPLVPSEGLLPFGPTFVGSAASADGQITVHTPSFSSAGNGFSAPPHDDFDLGGEFTVEASFAPQPPHGGGSEVVLAAFEETSGRMAWGIVYEPGDRNVLFVVHNQVNFPFVAEAKIPDDGRSHHVAGQMIQGEVRLYVDGELANSFPASGSIGPVEGRKLQAWLAPKAGALNGFNGVIDRARVTKAALSPGQFIPMGKPTDRIVISAHPASATVKALNTARFEVVATGPSPLRYQWTRNGDPIPNSNSRVLEIPQVTKANEGIYRVSISAEGVAPALSLGATLTVLENVDALLPSFVQQPKGVPPAPGQPYTVTAVVAGSGPITCQWFFNGRAIPGATQTSIRFDSHNPLLEGSYWLVASNPFGSRESDVMTVTHHAGPDAGAVQFSNRLTGVVDAPVTRHGGQRLDGRAYLVQLYYLHPEGVMRPTGGAVPFLTGASAGYFRDDKARYTPGILPQRSATFQVAAWAAAAGATYEEAREAGGEHGISAPFTLFGLGGGSIPQIPLAGLQPFALAAPKPRIATQPSDIEVLLGGVAEFGVQVEAVEPKFQWFRGTEAIPNATAATLRIADVTAAHAGLYHVAVSSLGQTAISREARLAVRVPDGEPPALVVESPLPGETDSTAVTLAGSASDNIGVVSLQWGRGGIVSGSLELREGRFRLEGVPLTPGLNNFFVEARDLAGNRARKEIAVRLIPGRFLALPTLHGVREGSFVNVPVRLTSKGDVGALNFALSYNADFLTDPELEWRANTFGALVQVNTATPGRVRAVYALPGTTLASGQAELATVRFRVRSVPENLTTPLGLEIAGLYSSVGDPLTGGAEAIPGAISVLRRNHAGDNNANDRLDVGDASIMLRMVSLLEPVRSWDVAGNDLNKNSELDTGDIIRVLRATVGLDPQPSGNLGSGGLVSAAAAGGAGFLLTAEPAMAAPGQKVVVRLALQGNSGPLHGAAFTLDYPAAALRLENAAAHRAGALVSANTLALWNLAPSQNDYASQSGRLSAALSGATQWPGANGEVAVFEFTVLEGAQARPQWGINLSGAEISNGFDVAATSAASVTWQAREALPATLAAALDASGRPVLTLAAEIGVRYVIQASGNLQQWENVHEATAESSALTFTDADAGDAPARFYRALRVD